MVSNDLVMIFATSEANHRRGAEANSTEPECRGIEAK